MRLDYGCHKQIGSAPGLSLTRPKGSAVTRAQVYTCACVCRGQGCLGACSLGLSFPTYARQSDVCNLHLLPRIDTNRTRTLRRYLKNVTREMASHRSGVNALMSPSGPDTAGCELLPYDNWRALVAHHITWRLGCLPANLRTRLCAHARPHRLVHSLTLSCWFPPLSPPLLPIPPSLPPAPRPSPPRLHGAAVCNIGASCRRQPVCFREHRRSPPGGYEAQATRPQ